MVNMKKTAHPGPIPAGAGKDVRGLLAKAPSPPMAAKFPLKFEEKHRPPPNHQMSTRCPPHDHRLHTECRPMPTPGFRGAKGFLCDQLFVSSGPPQVMYWPPLALSVEPVMNPASSEARNTTQRPTSLGSPNRPTGINGRILVLSTSSGTAITISVAI